MDINYNDRICIATGLLVSCVLWKASKRYEEYAIYASDNDFLDAIQSILPDGSVVHEIVGIQNATVVVKVYDTKSRLYSFVDVFFDPDTMGVRAHSPTTRYMESVGYMPVERYRKLTKNLTAHFYNHKVVGVTRLLVDGQVSVIVYDDRRSVNKVYDVSFDKTSADVESAVFLNIEFTNASSGAAPKSYNINEYFKLVRNAECHFGEDNVYGTIRLTDSVLTVIVRKHGSYVSRVYDIHYDKFTMNIRTVKESDIAHYINTTDRHDMHTLIKKSPLF